MSTGMNFTCISAFDASKDIIWSFSYKFEPKGGNLGNCGFTTFLNFLPSQTKGGIETGLGCGPYKNGSDDYDGVDENFLAIAFDSAGVFSVDQNGFNTGLSSRLANSITIRKDADFKHVLSKTLDFNIVSNEWQTLRFQLTNLGHVLNVFYCDKNFNYNKIATIQTDDAFYLPQQMYIGMSFATPIDDINESELKIKNFHFYGQPAIISPPTITKQSKEEYLIFGNNILLSASVAGARPYSYEWYKDGILIPNENNSEILIYDVGIYTIKVYNSAGSTLSEDIIVKEVFIPSFIIDLNNNYIIPSGSDNIVLTVSASGIPDPSYRWYKNNILIPYSNSNIITAKDIGDYMAIAYNIFGDVSSNVATIGAALPTVITLPISGAAPFFVATNTTGTSPLSYQWMKNGIDIEGANESYYYIEDDSRYNVKVSNIGGYIISNEISSFYAPVFTNELTGSAIGDTLTINVTGSIPIYYKWYKDDMLILGEVDNYFVTTDAGKYKVVASNIIGSITSNEAIVLATLPVQIESFIGPTCIDIITPINPADNTYIIEFDKPVILNVPKITKVFADNNLLIVDIIKIMPDASGYTKKYNITTKRIANNYSVIEMEDSVMTPTSLLTLRRNSDTPLREQNTGSLSSIKMPFFVNEMTTNTKTNKVSPSINSLLIVDDTSCTLTTHYSPPNYNASHPIIFINTTNVGSDMFKLYTGNFGDKFVIRWEGSQFKKSTNTASDIDTIWEAVFYKNYPDRLTIKADPLKWGGSGKTQVRIPVSGSTPKVIIELDSSTLKGKSFTIDSAHKIILPPDICFDAGGATNISNSNAVITNTCI